MPGNLLIQAFVKVILGIISVGLLIFLPAGTWNYWNGWLLMAVLFIPMPIVGAILLLKNPELLRKRLNTREREAVQGLVIKLSGIMFLVGFILAGLNFRFQWLILPKPVSWVAAGVFLLGYLLYAEVLRENTFLSRTVEVQEGQQVVSTGLYGIVRHPMYTATILLFLSMPLILGSIQAFIVFLVYPLIIAARIRGEERVLEAGLPGYKAYKDKVRYKLFPFVW